MTTDTAEVKFTCKECGGSVLKLPDNHTDGSIATCQQCGVPFGRWGDIKTKAVGMAKDQMIDMMKDAFKGIKGFNVK